MIYWKQIYINKSLIEETIKFWILEEIKKKQNEIRTKKDWDNTLLDEVLLIISGEYLLYCILLYIKISLKCEKKGKKKKDKMQKKIQKIYVFLLKIKKSDIT